MVVGDETTFPYRSSSVITAFFRKCGYSFRHDGSTRRKWVQDQLQDLNSRPGTHPELPSDDLQRLLYHLFDPDDFHKNCKDRDVALVKLNEALQLQDLIAYFDDQGACRVRNTGTGAISSAFSLTEKRFSPEELVQRKRVGEFLDSATEDDFTMLLLKPFFEGCGFQRVTVLGHHEKILEFGKDLWMKFKLPTGHCLYFGAQVKRTKLDARGGSGDANIATVLDQVRMALDNPIFDPDLNRKFLIDHVFVISSNAITRAAQNWLIERLDKTQRRAIIFMDKTELIEHSARISGILPAAESTTSSWVFDF